MKTFHLPGAGIGLFSGVLLIVFGFLPLFFYTTYKEQGEKRSFLMSLTGYLTVTTLLLGALFRLMHWPGTYKMVLVSQILLVAVFIPAYLISVFKKANETKTNIIYIIIIVGIGLGIVFMTSSVGISREAIDRYVGLNKEYVCSTDFFESTNDSLYTVILKENKNDALVLPLREKATVIEKLIIDSKTEMIKLVNTNYSSIEDFPVKDNYTASRNVLIRNDKGYDLVKYIEDYKNYLLSLPLDKPQKLLISSYLDIHEFKKEVYDGQFRRCSLIEAVTMLSEIHRNVKMAEYTALKAIK
jgi:hypothetical protein